MEQTTYPDTPYQRWLAAHDACEDAREWIGSKTPAEAWADMPRASWLLWQVARCTPPEEIRPALVQLANGFAARAARAARASSDAWAYVAEERASESAALAGEAALAEERASESAAWTARAAWEVERASAALAANAKMADEVRAALPMILPRLEN